MAVAAVAVVPAGVFVAEVLGVVAAGTTAGFIGYLMGRRVQRVDGKQNLRLPGAFEMRVVKAFPKLARKILLPQGINYSLCMAMCSRVTDSARRILCEFYCQIMRDDMGEP